MKSSWVDRILWLSIGLMLGGLLMLTLRPSPLATPMSLITPAPPSPLEGTYWVNDNPQDIVTLSSVAEGIYRAESAVWSGVGLFDGKLYIGLFRYKDNAQDFAGVLGLHVGTPKEEGLFSIKGTNVEKQTGSFEITWRRAALK